jgi:asparagine synthase (glutamine-hydrolysing)
VERLWEQHQTGAAELSWALWRWISLSQWLALGRRGVWRDGVGSCAS